MACLRLITLFLLGVGYDFLQPTPQSVCLFLHLLVSFSTQNYLRLVNFASKCLISSTDEQSSQHTPLNYGYGFTLTQNFNNDNHPANFKKR